MLDAQAKQHACELEELHLNSISETSGLRAKLLAATALDQEAAAKLLASERHATSLEDLASSLKRELEVERQAAVDAQAARMEAEKQLKTAFERAREMEAATAKFKGEADRLSAERAEFAAQVKGLEAEVPFFDHCFQFDKLL